MDEFGFHISILEISPLTISMDIPSAQPSAFEEQAIPGDDYAWLDQLSPNINKLLDAAYGGANETPPMFKRSVWMIILPNKVPLKRVRLSVFLSQMPLKIIVYQRIFVWIDQLSPYTGTFVGE